MLGGLTWEDLPVSWDSLSGGDLWDLGEFTLTDSLRLRPADTRDTIEAVSSRTDSLRVGFSDLAGIVGAVLVSDSLRLHGDLAEAAICIESWPEPLPAAGVPWNKSTPAPGPWVKAGAVASPWANQDAIHSEKAGCKA